jgi:hypothetical protein
MEDGVSKMNELINRQTIVAAILKLIRAYFMK